VLLSAGLIPENELSRTAGAVLSPVTGGPEVDEHCMTSVPGLFACGNVLHVHDIVDFVTEEACTAGKAAAAWAVQTAGHISQHAAQQISQEFITHPPSSRGPGLVTQPIIPGAGIRYTVPQRFHVHAASSSEHGNRQPQRSFMLSFRVSEPGGAALITVHQDGKQLLRRKRVRVHPSEMIRISVSPRPGVSAPLEVEVRPDA